jgi:hypothetical protein
MMLQEVISGIDRIQIQVYTAQEEIHPNFSRKYKTFGFIMFPFGNPVFEKSSFLVVGRPMSNILQYI